MAQMVKNLPQCRRPRFDPWVGKTPWRTEWLPTPVFLPREFHGQKILAGLTKLVTMLGKLSYTHYVTHCIVSSLNFHSSLVWQACCCPHFTDKETEAQSTQVPYLPRDPVVEAGFNSSQPDIAGRTPLVGNGEKWNCGCSDIMAVSSKGTVIPILAAELKLRRSG